MCISLFLYGVILFLLFFFEFFWEFCMQLFEFGDKYRGKYDKSVGVVSSYYPSVSGYQDELLWAALWLYRATDNQSYLNYVLQNALSFGGITWAISEFSWDVKYAGLQIIASMVNLRYLSDDS